MMSIAQKKAPAKAGASIRRKSASSISRRNRGAVATEPAETVVEANGEHIHVLGDPVVDKSHKARIRNREVVVIVPHEQMVIFNTDRPVRGEAIFPAHTYRSAPARRIRRDQTEPSGVVIHPELIAGYSGTALDVEQRGIPRPTEL